jgi:hypothetical protein
LSPSSTSRLIGAASCQDISPASTAAIPFADVLMTGTLTGGRFAGDELNPPTAAVTINATTTATLDPTVILRRRNCA